MRIVASYDELVHEADILLSILLLSEAIVLAERVAGPLGTIHRTLEVEIPL